MDAIAAQRVDAVLEIGPGQALARMWLERCGEIPARSVDDFRSAAAIVKWLLSRA
jgi:[acyl-carrier-protein] S-malonyltransferase